MDGLGVGLLRRAWRQGAVTPRLVLPALVVALLDLGLPRAAAAQSPQEVRDALTPPGMVVAAGAADPAVIADAVTRARAAGYELVVVVNALDLEPDPDAYALRVRQLGVGDPVVVFGPGGQLGVSSQALDGAELFRAREAAEAATTPGAASQAFADALVDDPHDTVPDLVRDVVRVAVIALGVLVASVLANEGLRLARRRRRARRPVPPAGG